jgi:hypothetical protein
LVDDSLGKRIKMNAGSMAWPEGNDDLVEEVDLTQQLPEFLGTLVWKRY